MEETSRRRGAFKGKLAKWFFQEFLFKANRKPQFTYSVLRLLLPSLDKERSTYGMKEKVLADIVSDALSLPSELKERMRNFRNPTFHPYGVPSGEFSEVLFSILKEGFCSSTNVVTVLQVNASLDSLSKTDSRQEQAKTLRELIRLSTPDEMK